MLIYAAFWEEKNISRITGWELLRYMEEQWDKIEKGKFGETSNKVRC